MADQNGESLGAKLRNMAKSIGPGIFIIGYVIGTGSITTMASAGAKYGMSMTWAVALSCVFTFVMLISISRNTIVSGQTLIHNIRRRFGNVAALFIIFSLMLTVITSIMGLQGIATDVVREWTRPMTASGNGVNPVITAAVFTAILYYLFWKGSHGFFLRAMAVIVAIMGASFIVTMFMVVPSPSEIIAGLVPKFPTEANAHLILAGLVGTTMATVCVVTRSYLVSEEKWTFNDLKTERRDAMLSMFLTFLVSAAIMASAAGTMYPRGIVVENAIDMIQTLEPLAGRFSTSLFVVGVMAAALSSLFASYVLGPWLVFDYMNKPRRMSHPGTRIAVFLIALTGFVVPVFGGRPVIIMIASQAVSPVVMPLLIVFLIILLNSRENTGKHKNPLALNIALGITLVFSLFMSYSATLGLIDFIRNF